MKKLLLYQLIISQLQEDGFPQAARVVSEATMTPFPQEGAIEEQKLLKLVDTGVKVTAKSKERSDHPINKVLEEAFGGVLAQQRDRCLDYESVEKGKEHVLTLPDFQTRFITTHKDVCRCAQFSNDGKLVVTGSNDSSIKLIDVDKMKHYKSDGGGDEFTQSRPVARTFYDHSQTVNELMFHPFLPMLASCSADQTIKFYDYSKASTKKASRSIQDTHGVRSIHFHPSGDFLLAGTDHHMIRLYDLNSGQAFTCSDPKDHHQSSVNVVRYAYTPNISIFASCSKDGTIKLWDSVQNKCIKTLVNAHNGFEVTCLQFSRNHKYLLSGGRDSHVRIWDLATDRQLRSFNGCVQTATFNHTEDFVLTSDEGTSEALVWDSRTGTLVQRLTGHSNHVRAIAASPVENSLMTCSDDHRARYWVGTDPPPDFI
ncbi:Cleavage stimulation factor 50 kDa subunit [Balamuthia mandrillaris]